MLTLSTFVAFARHCPRIVELGLFVDAGAGAGALAPSDSGSGADVDIDIEFLCFKNLAKLSMGVSDMKDESVVALFLPHFCPFGVVIECGVMWHTDLVGWRTPG
jgi:hypothetical protein